MSRQPVSPASFAAEVAARNRRRRPESWSERVIYKFLITWLLLLGGVLLTQAFPFRGSAQLGYWLLVGVALGSPVMALLLLWLMWLRLREALHRLRVLRRAAKWPRPRPSTAWLEEEWTGQPR